MRSEVDALRSLAKYVYYALGDEWEVRLAFEEGTFKRPFARVGFAGRAVVSGPAHTIDVTQAFNVLCHPVEKTLADEALLEAGRIVGVLNRLFSVGISLIDHEDPDDPSSPEVTVKGGARRVPLWDWDGRSLEQDTSKRYVRDYLRVDDAGSDIVHDPSDDLLKAVACDVRLKWRQPGVQYTGIPLRGIRPVFEQL